MRTLDGKSEKMMPRTIIFGNKETTGQIAQATDIHDIVRSLIEGEAKGLAQMLKGSVKEATGKGALVTATVSVPRNGGTEEVYLNHVSCVVKRAGGAETLKGELIVTANYSTGRLLGLPRVLSTLGYQTPIIT